MGRIIIGIDEKEPSRDAIAFGRMLAMAGGASVTVVSAYAWEPANALHGSYEYDKFLRSETETVLADAADGLRGVSDVKHLALADPSPARALQHLAAEEGAGLIVVGSSHTGRLGRVLPGSTAERLLHGAPCPVAVVPAGYAAAGPHEPRVIAASWDGSPQADAALGAAEEIARRTSAALRVVRVSHASNAYPPGLGIDYATQVERLRDHVRAELDERVAGLKAGVRAEAVLVEGDPVDALIDLSESVDLIVLGSRGYGPLRAVLLGGVSGKVMQSAACPLIVIPNGADSAVGSMFAPMSEQPA